MSKKTLRGTRLKRSDVSMPEGAVMTQNVVDADMPPMPEQHLLDQQLLQVLESMNIPKAKVQEMLQQPNQKKWQLVWGQYKHKVRHTPGHYLNSLVAHLEARDKQRRKKSKSLKLPSGIESPATILRNIEIALRTNPLSWVKEFIGYEPPYDEKDKTVTRRSGGLNILMEYFASMSDSTR
ncbi:hypothetical protein PTSG_06934 [Salpingoeca rosetta]|uniref:Formin GTPase-binding domain-containing protein n=1 Tax=Salpingoeca rosetta (strain ATCC 50818 / BSB-021) TaxID=946362 RepID=F2UF82_SALR5|nr:uncharacterized protein PTSG_06934 [Salpingoeca rosetta]EGD75282.1 hypothetical protein PTSG_06934 [Salpingoeca rosetta]|eukprot:XP_004992335.1 hypothetical protein PTSG_06934 [Salpingoeca rosetta]